MQPYEHPQVFGGHRLVYWRECQKHPMRRVGTRLSPSLYNRFSTGENEFFGTACHGCLGTCSPRWVQTRGRSEGGTGDAMPNVPAPEFARIQTRSVLLTLTRGLSPATSCSNVIAMRSRQLLNGITDFHELGGNRMWRGI